MIDMQESTTTITLSKYLFFGLMAILGGFVHSLIALRKGETKGWIDFASLAIISGFSGVMWTLLSLIYFPNNIYAVGFAAGMGGYLSVEGLSLIVSYLKERFK